MKEIFKYGVISREVIRNMLWDKDYTRNDGDVFVFDVEGNGLLDTIDKIWCIVMINAKTKEIEVYHEHPEYDNSMVYDKYDNRSYKIPARSGNLRAGAARLTEIAKTGKVVCHNILGYDWFVLKKFFPEDFNVSFGNCVDTLIQSKVQWFDRRCPKGAKGAHGLQAWGIRGGVHKPDVSDWSTIDPFKIHRCIEDVRINLWAYEQLEVEREEIKKRCGIDFTEALTHEKKYRFCKTLQELRGAPIDKKAIKDCLEDLDKKLEELKAEIEPELPPTIKIKSTKITRNEILKMLGYSDKYIASLKPEKVIIKVVDGKLVRTIAKPYYKPTVNYSKKVTEKTYSAICEELGVHKEGFSKVSEARDYMRQVTADMDKKQVKKLKWIYPATIVEKSVLNSNTCSWFGIEEDSDLIGGFFTRITFENSKLTQGNVVKSFLISLGWQPTEWTPSKDEKGQPIKAEKNLIVKWPPRAAKNKQVSLKVPIGGIIPSSPKLTEDSYESLPEGIGLKIAHYNTYKHRRSFLENPTDGEKGLLNQIRKDGRVACGVNCFGTATGRASHYNWVNAPGIGALYGKEIRKVIKPENGRVLIGCDMKSAQLSIAAYFAKNWLYYDAIVNGLESIRNEDGTERYIGESGHCVNARAFGLVSEEEWRRAVKTQDKDLILSIAIRRGLSKRCTFGTLFGCSGKKLAKMAKVADEKGQEMKEKFLKDIGLDVVIKTLEKMMKKNKRGNGGYIELPFGYFVHCTMAHKAFNYLDQGTEAALQKIATTLFEKRLAQTDLDAYTILDYHDELLIESSKEDSEKVGKLVASCYKDASDMCMEWHNKHSRWFNQQEFPFNLDGGFKIGENYLEVH